jgi:Holliday junction DNA helicase RuvB
VKISSNGSFEIASRSRGTPRIALRLLRRVHDFADVSGSNEISKELANDSLNRLDVDYIGLDNADRKYLNYIAKNYEGGPVGIETIAAGLSEQRDSIEETIEPYLLQIGFIQRTPRGRVLSAKAFEHLKLLINTKSGLF